MLAFFEVKTRSNDLFGRPSDAVDGEKVKRINTAARDFLRTYKKGNRIPVFFLGKKQRRRILKQRIDVIEVYLTPNGETEKINHIKDWENML